MPETMDNAAAARRPKPIQTVVAEPCYNVREVAAHLRVEKSVVYRAVNDGALRATRVGRLIRISQSALNEFIAGGTA